MGCKHDTPLPKWGLGLLVMHLLPLGHDSAFHLDHFVTRDDSALITFAA